ncbi:MAG: hypothetical protein F6K42_29490 [Leptolyngbya sp. SIO1D8]|nr:hypothetical protein [Leptolyngbya sp. SIO1D8]
MPLDIQQAYVKTRQIIENLSTGSGQGIQIIYEPSQTSPYDRVPALRYYGFITDLRLKVDISSLPQTAIPDIDISTSRTERAERIRQMEWESDRYEMQLLMQDTYSGGWLEIARLSLLNRSPYYQINILRYMTDQIALNVANDARLGMQFIDAGYGLPKSEDSLVIFGAVREEITAIPTDSEEITLSNAYSKTLGESSDIIAPANPQRKQLTIVNNSATATVFLSYGANSELNEGISLHPNGGAYEINFSNTFKGAVSGISEEENTSLSVFEAY